MKIAIIGGSGHFRYVLDELKNHTLLGIAPGVVGEDLEKLQEGLATKNIEAKAFDDWKKLVKDADVAVVNTRPDKNAIVSAYCLERNIHVFSEKPLAVDMKQLKMLGKVAEKSKAMICAMFGIRYSGWYQLVKEELKNIGTIRLINAHKSYKLGKRPEFYDHKETFSGIIPWVSIHALDWILDLTGAKVTSISAANNAEHNFGHGDLEMTSLCMLQLEGGILASVTADFLRPEGAPTKNDDRIRIVGTKGMLEFAADVLTKTDLEGQSQLTIGKDQDVFELFLRRIGGEEVGVTPQESFYATELALNLQAMACE